MKPKPARTATVKLVPLAALKAHPRNPRRHDRGARPLVWNHWVKVYCHECHNPRWGNCRARRDDGCCLQPIDADWPLPKHELKT